MSFRPTLVSVGIDPGLTGQVAILVKPSTSKVFVKQALAKGIDITGGETVIAGVYPLEYASLSSVTLMLYNNITSALVSRAGFIDRLIPQEPNTSATPLPKKAYFKLAVTVERVHAFKGQGISSSFNFGAAFGQATALAGMIFSLLPDVLHQDAILRNTNLYQYVLPKAWRKAVISEHPDAEYVVGDNATKELSIRHVKQTYLFSDGILLGASSSAMYELDSEVAKKREALKRVAPIVDQYNYAYERKAHLRKPSGDIADAICLAEYGLITLEEGRSPEALVRR